MLSCFQAILAVYFKNWQHSALKIEENSGAQYRGTRKLEILTSLQVYKRSHLPFVCPFQRTGAFFLSQELAKPQVYFLVDSKSIILSCSKKCDKFYGTNMHLQEPL